MKKERVLLGMSGGVDSSVAAVLLKEQGYEVVGITMQLIEDEQNKTLSNSSATLDAKRICDYLDIPHYSLNLTEEFNKYVIKDFCNCYANCKTPNPCIECNKYIKFGIMNEKAKELNCDYISTGHYAKIEFSEKYNKYILKKANSIQKDQSYVLWNIPKEIVSKIIFPLSDYSDKEEIREIARKHNLPVAEKKDSQDICFIPDGDYKKFLELNSNIKPKEGNIVNSKGEHLGKHEGLYYYTIGQRKGLGISNPVPLFVIGFNKNKNEVIVGEEKELYKKELEIENVNIILFDKIIEPLKVMTKTRYSAKEFSSIIYPTENNKIKIIFDEPQRAITPGQSAVFYIDDILVRRREDYMMKEKIPEFLYEMLLNEYGEKITKEIVNGYVNKKTTFRVNTLKTNSINIKDKLNEIGIEFEQAKWNEEAFIIENIKEIKIQELDIYKNGEIYLQSLSSMLPPIFVDPREGENILDMAAAPGGKTTQMASISDNKAMLTACEKNKIRAERLKYNLEKQGVSRATVMLKDARKLDDCFSFDKILLDAPCSGSGTLNIENNTNIDKTFTKELIDRSIKTQKELLKKAIKILKKNGELIYSTCSILKEENEKVIEEILKMGNIEVVSIEIESLIDIPLLPTNIKGTICVCPTDLYEGFFVAKLRKIK